MGPASDFYAWKQHVIDASWDTNRWIVGSSDLWFMAHSQFRLGESPTIATCELSLPSSFFLEFTPFFVVTNMVTKYWQYLEMWKSIYIHLHPIFSLGFAEKHPCPATSPITWLVKHVRCNPKKGANSWNLKIWGEYHPTTMLVSHFSASFFWFFSWENGVNPMSQTITLNLGKLEYFTNLS